MYVCESVYVCLHMQQQQRQNFLKKNEKEEVQFVKLPIHKIETKDITYLRDEYVDIHTSCDVHTESGN